MPDCTYSHFTKNHRYTELHPHPHPSSLEQFLRALWGAVSWATVLMVPPKKLDSKLSHCAFIFKLTFFARNCCDSLSIPTLPKGWSLGVLLPSTQPSGENDGPALVYRQKDWCLRKLNLRKAKPAKAGLQSSMHPCSVSAITSYSFRPHGS